MVRISVLVRFLGICKELLIEALKRQAVSTGWLEWRWGAIAWQMLPLPF